MISSDDAGHSPAQAEDGSVRSAVESPVHNVLREPPRAFGSGDAVAFLVYVCLVGAYFIPLLGPGLVLGMRQGDVATYFYFNRACLAEVFRAGGSGLFWNPYQACGLPFLASYQSAPFFPLNWLAPVLSTTALINTQTILFFLSGMAALHLLALRMGRSAPAAAVAALVFGFSGFAVMHWWAGHLIFMAQWPFLPLSVLCLAQIHDSCSRRMYRRALGGALLLCLCMSLQFLAGHVQLVYMTVLALTGQYIFALIALLKGRRGTEAAVMTALIMIGAMLTILLTAVQAAPFLLHIKEMDRAFAQPDDFYLLLSTPPLELMTAFAPWIFGGRPGTMDHLGTDLHEITLFISATACVLTVFAAFGFSRRTWFEKYLLLLLVISMWMALGKYGGLYPWLRTWLPGLRWLRCPGRFALLVTFAASLLAAAGVDDAVSLARSGSRFTRRFVLVGTGFLLLALAGCAVVYNLGPAHWFIRAVLKMQMTPGMRISVVPYHGNFVFSLMAAIFTALVCLLLLWLLRTSGGRLRAACPWILVLLLTAELLTHAWPYRSSYRVAAELWPPAVCQIMERNGPMYRVTSGWSYADLNQASVWKERHVWVYEPVIPYRYEQTIIKSQGARYEEFLNNAAVFQTTPFTRAIGMRLLMVPRSVNPPASSGWRAVETTRGRSFYEDSSALPRAFTVGRSTLVDEKEVAEAVNRSDFQPTATVILSEPRLIGFAEAPAGEFLPGTVKIVRDDPESFEAEVSMRAPGWFVLMDQLLDGWQARVNDVPEKIYRANGIGRALPLQAGEHKISMRYEAPGWKPGLVMSMSGIILWLIAFGWLLVGGTRVAVSHRDRVLMS